MKKSDSKQLLLVTTSILGQPPREITSVPPEDNQEITASKTLTLGWREWLAIPGLNIPAIKAKIDTGAKTSALHAINIEVFKREGMDYLKFAVQPLQYTNDVLIDCVSRLVDERTITDSGGHQEERFVIETQLMLGETEQTVEMTLTDRSSMKFRMLLGRDAMHDPILVHPSASYRLGRLHHRSIYNT